MDLGAEKLEVIGDAFAIGLEHRPVFSAVEGGFVAFEVGLDRIFKLQDALLDPRHLGLVNARGMRIGIDADALVIVVDCSQERDADQRILADVADAVLGDVRGVDADEADREQRDDRAADQNPQAFGDGQGVHREVLEKLACG